MIRQRPVARFAIHMRMLARLLFICFVCVARLTGLMAGKLHRLGRNLIHCRRTIMPILSKCLGNDPVTDHQKRKKRESK